MGKKPDGQKVIARNKKARFNFEVIESFEAGIALQGTEVKSLREGKVSLSESFARVDGGELFLMGAHIDTYKPGSFANHDPVRPRKLLMRRKEIHRIAGKVAERGLTMVPLSMYFKRGFAKVELALVRGKQKYDKRQAIRKRESERSLRRAMSSRGRRGLG